MNTCDKCGTDNTKNARYCCGCGYELPKQATAEVQDTIEPVKKKDNKKLIGMISGAISFIVFYLLFQQLFFKAPSIDIVLMKTASELNVSCPVMVDRETRLDNMIALPANVFQYNYTLISVDKEFVDTIEAKKILEPTITNTIRTSPDLKYFRDNEVTMRYYYKDKDGNYLFAISVTPEQYK